MRYILMMKCETAHSFAEAWENGSGARADIDGFKEHLSVCADCSRRYGALLHLMERDCVPEAGSAPIQPPAGLADAVMASVGKRRRPAFAFSPFLAAAGMLVVIGLGLGIFFAKPRIDMVSVRFSLEAPQAKTVHLAGDFNGWGAKSYELRRADANSPWEISLSLEKGKIYVYNFVLDGSSWIPDPQSLVRVDDGFGGSGSLLRL